MKKLPIFTVKKIIKELEKFIALTNKYFDSLKRDGFGHAVETSESLIFRSQINSMVSSIEEYVSYSDTRDEFLYRAPPLAGGYTQNVPLIQNIFNLTNNQISYLQLVDVLERALSDYKNDVTKSWIRTFSPFYWLGILITLITKIPFDILNAAGFNGEKIKKSYIGAAISKLISASLWLVTILAGIATLIESQKMTAFIKEIMGKL